MGVRSAKELTVYIKAYELAMRIHLLTMSFTMEDFRRQFVKEHFPQLTPEEQLDVLKSLPPETRLAGLSAEQIQQYLAKLKAGRPTRTRKPRRKK